MRHGTWGPSGSRGTSRLAISLEILNNTVRSVSKWQRCLYDSFFVPAVWERIPIWHCEARSLGQSCEFTNLRIRQDGLHPLCVRSLGGWANHGLAPSTQGSASLQHSRGGPLSALLPLPKCTFRKGRGEWALLWWASGLTRLLVCCLLSSSKNLHGEVIQSLEMVMKQKYTKGLRWAFLGEETISRAHLPVLGEGAHPGRSSGTQRQRF